MRRLIANIKVFIAGKTNNRYGRKSFDVHDRSYTYVYKKFGHEMMVDEYLRTNGWGI